MDVTQILKTLIQALMIPGILMKVNTKDGQTQAGFMATGKGEDLKGE